MSCGVDWCSTITGMCPLVEVGNGVYPSLTTLAGESVLVRNTGWRVPLALHVGQTAYFCLEAEVGG